MSKKTVSSKGLSAFKSKAAVPKSNVQRWANDFDEWNGHQVEAWRECRPWQGHTCSALIKQFLKIICIFFKKCNILLIKIFYLSLSLSITRRSNKLLGWRALVLRSKTTEEPAGLPEKIKRGELLALKAARGEWLSKMEKVLKTCVSVDGLNTDAPGYTFSLGWLQRSLSGLK